MLQAARPANAEQPTPEENQRLAAACSVLGWLHFMRYTALPGPPRNFSELARVINFFAPLTHDNPHPIPEPLHDVLGAAAEAGLQADLAYMLLEQAQSTTDPALPDAAIWLLTASLAATPHDHPDRPVCLANLGSAYRVRFDRGGVLADLEQAIEASERAVAATPNDHPNRPAYLANLGHAYTRRFERGGVLADLDQAISAFERAMAATPDDHPDKPSRWSNLGVVYMGRFERGGVLADLDQALEASERAMAATPDDDPNRPMYLSNLGTAYQRRFDHGGVLVDLNQAIEVGGEAVAATPHDHPEQPTYLAHLGMAYQRRFDHGGVLADLNQAIQALEQAVATTPLDHPDRLRWLANLGRVFEARLDISGQDIDRETLRALAGHVTAARTASPSHRVRAGEAMGSLAHAAGEHSVAVELLDAAVSMLPSVAPREAGWADQEHRLGEHGGLVGETVAAHCAINDPVGAVEAAELGRGVLLAAQLDSRSELIDLEQAHPELAVVFRGIGDQLNAPQAAGTRSSQSGIDPVGGIEHRRRLWAKHDQLLAQIRQQDDFARFLLPPRLADLQPATAGGAAILVNSGRRRSDAIIITSESSPVHVPLPDAELADVESQALALLSLVQGNGLVSLLRRQRVVPEILSWLWESVVAPIIKALKDLPPAAEPMSALPRVWWLPTGLLGLFPLHAAGHPNEPGALDAIISSYTPTLRTLAHSRTRPPTTARRQLTVALRHTPGQPDLPGTVAEATTLHTNHADNRLLLDQDATTSRVLAALPEASWAHFACHASANLTTPSEGGLDLHDATLALPEISQLRLNDAELAYLSACSTAHRGLRVADESLHLASAFQLAGFRHVIASLWPLDDHIAATIATAIYQHISTTPTADHAATALHHVTRELRSSEEYRDRPDLWAALIHSGP